MWKLISLSLLLACFSYLSYSQTYFAASKECRISTGIGFANATQNVKAVGKDFWLQLDYKAMEHFSVALEFENFGYKQGGYYQELPLEYHNEIKVLNNNFSLLIKYHVPSKGKLKLALASGWTYSIRHNDYYRPPYNQTSQTWPQYVTSFTDYRIPLLAEAQYPVSKNVNLLTRLKYNLNPQNGNTYAAGIGLSLKL